jgi:hypothetical protein
MQRVRIYSTPCVDTALQVDIVHTSAHLPVDIPGIVFDANGLANVFLVGDGRALTFRNLTMKGFALPDAYRYDALAAPYRLAGAGLGFWPTVDLAPGSRVSSKQVEHT